MKEKEKRRGRQRGDQAKIKRYGCLDFGMELGFSVWKLNLCINFHALMVIFLPKSRVFARVSF